MMPSITLVPSTSLARPQLGHAPVAQPKSADVSDDTKIKNVGVVVGVLFSAVVGRLAYERFGGPQMADRLLEMLRRSSSVGDTPQTPSAAEVPASTLMRYLETPQWMRMAALGDEALKTNAYTQAADQFRAALDTLFLLDADMKNWKSSRASQPDAPMPYAGDILRIRTKLSDVLVEMVKRGDVEVRTTYDLNRDLPVLGPTLWVTTTERLITEAKTLPQLLMIVRTLGTFDDMVKGTFVPDFHQQSFGDDQLRLLRGVAEKIAAVVVNDQASVEDIRTVAEVYKSLLEATLRQEGRSVSNDNVSQSRWTPQAVDAAKTTILYYLDVIDRAALWGSDTKAYHEAIFDILDRSGNDLDVVTSALRMTYMDDSRSIAEDWAKRAEERFTTTRTIEHALDAATQWFVVGNDADAARVLQVFFEGTSVARAFGLVPVGSLGLRMDVIAAALGTFGKSLEEGGEVPSFDWLQVRLAQHVDMAIRTALRILGPDMRRPLLPKDLALSTRIPADVQLSAVLEEVMRSNGDAPYAIEEAAGLLNQRTELDPVMLQQALRGEAVEGPVADALKAVMPHHLERPWQVYVAIKAEEAIIAKHENDMARERGERRSVEEIVAP